MATTFSSPTATMFAKPRFTSSMSKNGRGPFRNQHPSKTNRSFGSRNPNKQSSTPTFNLQNPRTQCQICNKFGHSALNCWYRYESSPSTINANTSQFTSSTQDNEEASILGTPSTLHDPLWYPDSRATNHLTPDASTLNHKTPYTGSEMVKIGNNTSLSKRTLVLPLTLHQIFLPNFL